MRLLIELDVELEPSQHSCIQSLMVIIAEIASRQYLCKAGVLVGRGNVDVDGSLIDKFATSLARTCIASLEEAGGLSLKGFFFLPI